MRAWMSTKFPLELAAAFDLEVFCPESFGAASAQRGTAPALLGAADRRGYGRDLCSYTRMGLAAARELPRPDVLLCCDNICTNMVQWYQALSQMTGAPLLLLDIPYQCTGGVSEETLNYLEAQFYRSAEALERITGRKWDEAAFRRCCEIENESAEIWERILDRSYAPDAALESFELYDAMPLLVTGRCSVGTAARLRAMEAELSQRPRRQERRYRIFFEGTPCFPIFSELKEALSRRKITVAADTLTPSLTFRYEDLRGLLRAYCGTINGTGLDAGLARRLELCRRARVDGVLVHYNRSCRAWCAALPELERRMREALGIPVISFGGDQGDPDANAPAQLETRLDGLLELMEAQRYGD